MAKFEGIAEAFRYTPNAAVDPNTVVKIGALIGVTRQSIAAGETAMVFMTAPKSLYSFPLATAPAVAAIAQGALVAQDSNGKIKAADVGDTAIGILWNAVKVGDNEAIVALAGEITPEADASSSSST